MSSEAGDVRAILSAIEADRPRYVAFLRRRLGAASDAEDVYQQAIVRAIEHADAMRDAAHVSAWFWRILRNALADHHASRLARGARDAAWVADAAPAPAEPAGPCACAIGLLPKLPSAYGEILRRVDVCDERVVDVARDLGISTDNAAVRLHRARKALRERLRGCCKVGSMRACFACDCADEAHASDAAESPPRG